MVDDGGNGRSEQNENYLVAWCGKSGEREMVGGMVDIAGAEAGAGTPLKTLQAVRQLIDKEMKERGAKPGDFRVTRTDTWAGVPQETWNLREGVSGVERGG